MWSIESWFKGKQIIFVDKAFSLLLEIPYFYVTGNGILETSLEIFIRS